MSSAVIGELSTRLAITLPSVSSRPCIELIRLVRKYDGHTACAVTPYAASSWPVVSVSATTAAFTALYDAIPAGCTRPASDAVLTIVPLRCRLNIGTNVVMPRTTPNRLISVIQRHSSIVATSSRPPPATPRC